MPRFSLRSLRVGGCTGRQQPDNDLFIDRKRDLIDHFNVYIALMQIGNLDQITPFIGLRGAKDPGLALGALDFRTRHLDRIISAKSKSLLITCIDQRHEAIAGKCPITVERD